MATPWPYGYGFIGGLPDDCICKICHRILRQPVQTKCCGHRFCKDCLVEATKSKSECPIDRKPLNIQQDVFDDKGAEQTVKSLRITCPRRSSGCQWQGELSDGKEHDQKCDYMMVPCTFQHSGCNFKIQRKNMKEHLEREMKNHLVLTSEHLSSLEKVHFKFIWKIINFDENFKKAKEPGQKNCMHSDPFYTDKYGYKMRVKLYPNGKSDEDAGHVSIFIEILRGEYDAVLPWPFPRKTTTTLLDQKENLQKRKNVENTLSYKELLNYPQCFWRPNSDSNTGHGYPKFISHENLMTENYIVDDTIFVQVEVREQYTGPE